MAPQKPTLAKTTPSKQHPYNLRSSRGTSNSESRDIELDGAPKSSEEDEEEDEDEDYDEVEDNNGQDEDMGAVPALDEEDLKIVRREQWRKEKNEGSWQTREIPAMVVDVVNDIHSGLLKITEMLQGDPAGLRNVLDVCRQGLHNVTQTHRIELDYDEEHDMDSLEMRITKDPNDQLLSSLQPDRHSPQLIYFFKWDGGLNATYSRSNLEEAQHTFVKYSADLGDELRKWHETKIEPIPHSDFGDLVKYMFRPFDKPGAEVVCKIMDEWNKEGNTFKDTAKKLKEAAEKEDVPLLQDIMRLSSGLFERNNSSRNVLRYARNVFDCYALQENKKKLYEAYLNHDQAITAKLSPYLKNTSKFVGKDLKLRTAIWQYMMNRAKIQEGDKESERYFRTVSVQATAIWVAVKQLGFSVLILAGRGIIRTLGRVGARRWMLYCRIYKASVKEFLPLVDGIGEMLKDHIDNGNSFPFAIQHNELAQMHEFSQFRERLGELQYNLSTPGERVDDDWDELPVWLKEDGDPVEDERYEKGGSASPRKRKM